MLDKLHYFTIVNDFCLIHPPKHLPPLLPEYISTGGKKNLFIRPELIRSSSRLGTIFGSYIFTSISLCHPENLAGKYHLYFRALATINPIGQFFIKTNSSSYFSPYKHFWNYLKLDPIPFALKESLQYLVTWEDHMPKSRHRNRQPFLCPQFKSHIPVNRTSIVIEIGGV